MNTSHSRSEDITWKKCINLQEGDADKCVKISWTADVLPTSSHGELKISFRYDYQRINWCNSTFAVWIIYLLSPTTERKELDIAIWVPVLVLFLSCRVKTFSDIALSLYQSRIVVLSNTLQDRSGYKEGWMVPWMRTIGNNEIINSIVIGKESELWIALGI